MDLFPFQDGVAHCESISLTELASKFGTPLYVYSRAVLSSRCRELREAFGSHPALICFAVKANGNLSLLREIFSHGIGADVVSRGELERALLAGVKADTIVFSGVGKTEEEIARALEAGILSLNVESPDELELVARIARRLGRRAPISLRINPDIDVKTHPHIATGLHCNKFGMPETAVRELLLRFGPDSPLDLVGIACHVGSQITELDPFRETARRMAALAVETQRAGHPLKLLDLGGGLGIAYQGEKIPSFKEYAGALVEETRAAGMAARLVIEPGRSIVGECGILVTRVLGVKRMPQKNFVIVDAAMNDLMRPVLYDAYHEILPVKAGNGPKMTADVVGPVCETGDFLGLDREMPVPARGDLLFVKNCGAYGASMASNYNVRPRAAEVLVDKESVWVIRKRESLEELWRPEM